MFTFPDRSDFKNIFLFIVLQYYYSIKRYCRRELWMTGKIILEVYIEKKKSWVISNIFFWQPGERLFYMCGCIQPQDGSMRSPSNFNIKSTAVHRAVCPRVNNFEGYKKNILLTPVLDKTEVQTNFSSKVPQYFIVV